MEEGQAPPPQQPQQQGCRFRWYHIFLILGVVFLISSVAIAVSIGAITSKYSGSDSETKEKKSDTIGIVMGVVSALFVLACIFFVVFGNFGCTNSQPPPKDPEFAAAGSAQATEMRTRSGSSSSSSSSSSSKKDKKKSKEDKKDKSDFADQQYPPGQEYSQAGYAQYPPGQPSQAYPQAGYAAYPPPGQY